MDDAEYARQKERIAPLIETWVGPLGLKWWDIEFGYERENFLVNGEPAPNTLARCSSSWRYGHAYIEFNMSQVREQSDADLERGFVHELMHVFLNETRESGKDWLDHEERVASTLTKAFLWQRDALMGARPSANTATTEFVWQPDASESAPETGD